MASANVKLKYCLLDGEIRDVTDFANLARGQRPDVTCIECGSRLLLKLGKIKAHHAAHLPDASPCLLNTPEGALHLNTKLYVAGQINSGSKLYLQQKCVGTDYRIKRGITYVRKSYRNCSTTRGHWWIEDWDEVIVEKRLTDVRPDIVLMRNGSVLAAIEIFSTHAVDDEKREKFQRAGILWIEIKAHGSSCDQRFTESGNEEKWTLLEPLPWHDMRPLLPDWRCESCSELQAIPVRERREHEVQRTLALVRKRRQDELQKKYGDPGKNRVLFAQAFELRHASGERSLQEVFILERNDPVTSECEVYVRLGRNSLEPWISESSADPNAKRRLNERFKRWKESLSNSCSILSLTNGWIDERSYFRKITENYLDLDF